MTSSGMAGYDFKGWPVLVTGGATGIGLECAKQFAGAGARVLLVGRRHEAIEAALASLPGEGHQGHAADAADEAELTPGIQSFAAAAGPLKAAVLSAGSHLVRPLAISKAEHFETMMRSNVTTAAVAARLFAKYAAKDGAAMVMTSSAAMKRGGAGVSAYAAAKAAVAVLARALAVELAPRRIRVNVVVPGVVRTKMSEDFLATLDVAQRTAIEQSHLLGIGEPGDVANAICFLLSAQARWITGIELVVDGGLTCK